MKFFKIIGIISIVIFSFIYTEEIANLTIKKNSLYEEISLNASNYNVKSVNATIDGEYIIPGINGKNVDVKSSFFNMKSFNVFNEYYLKYKSIKPVISLNDNKDKIIIKGNSIKNSVSFIIPYDENILNVFKKYSIPVSILVDNNTYNKNEINEQINNDYKEYKKLEYKLNKDKKNTNICYITNVLEDICKENQKYLVKSVKNVNNSNVINIKNNIESGDIYYIYKNTDKKTIDILLNSIGYKDLNIISLSNLISE